MTKIITRQDINYILVHIIIFLAAYSSAMSAMIHANPTFSAWFDWQAFSAGLIAIGGTSLGISVVGKSAAKQDQEQSAQIAKEKAKEQIKPEEVK